MVRVIDKQAQAEPNFDRANPTPANSAARYQIFNIGNGKRINLMDYVHVLEQALGIKANYQMLPMQPGNVEATNSHKIKRNTRAMAIATNKRAALLKRDIGKSPNTSNSMTI